SEDKFGMSEDELQSILDAALEAAIIAARLIETDQRLYIVRSQRAPICFSRQRAQDLFRAWQFIALRRRRAQKNLASARGVHRLSSVQRTFDRDGTDLRSEREALDEIVVEDAAAVMLVQVHIRNVRCCDEREPDGSFAGFY